MGTQNCTCTHCCTQPTPCRNLDVPTSYLALAPDRAHNDDPTIEAVLEAINHMLIDLMVAMARKDYLSRRDRQRQGIEIAKQREKYRGRQADPERRKKVIYFSKEKGLSLQETADATADSRSRVCRILAEYRRNKE